LGGCPLRQSGKNRFFTVQGKTDKWVKRGGPYGVGNLHINHWGPGTKTLMLRNACGGKGRFLGFSVTARSWIIGSAKEKRGGSLNIVLKPRLTEKISTESPRALKTKQ